MSAPGGRRDADVDVGDGLRIHYSVSGSGPPLVLLHGFTGSADSWSPVRDSLDAACTTIAIDLPGHGRSSAPASPSRYALDRFADDLAALLDAERAERAALLGYSMGGRAALRFALAHPARVAALVLESASPGIADAAERSARVAADLSLADEIEREGVAAFVHRWERLPLWESQRALGEEARAQLRAQRLANRPAGLANSLRGAGAGAAPPVLDRLPTLTAPALVVAGALDARYVELGRAMAWAMPRARLVVVPEAGHAVHLERPGALAAAVGAFLREVPSAEGRWR